MQFAVVTSSARVSDRDLSFLVDACDQQAIECARAWNVPPMPVAFYANVDDLPIRKVRVAHIVDDLEHPGALGYHTQIAGVAFSKVLAQDVIGTGITLSHEILETLLDPDVNEWRDLGGGRQVALEVCDPVEADTYGVTATILGEQRQVLLSNYVLPRWFDAAAPGGFDRMGKLARPFEMSAGGYMIVRERNGEEHNVFARFGGERARANLGARVANPDSRLRRRLKAT